MFLNHEDCHLIYTYVPICLRYTSLSVYSNNIRSFSHISLIYFMIHMSYKESHQSIRVVVSQTAVIQSKAAHWSNPCSATNTKVRTYTYSTTSNQSLYPRELAPCYPVTPNPTLLSIFR